jgi:hypothetical protein
MKKSGFGLIVLLFCAGLFAQTVHEGQEVFFSDQGDIVMAADASVAVQKLDSPYIMVMLYMGMKNFQHGATINRNDVVMVYKDQEYKMPAIKELGENYGGLLNDADLYRVNGKETLALSQMRQWKYKIGEDFFPLPNQLGIEEASIASNLGFRTRVYFKNPGFIKGDQIVIEVKDKKNPNVTGAVAVILK